MSLAVMKEARVFDIDVSSDGTRAEFIEGCDQYFSVSMSKDAVGVLIHDLQILYTSMKHVKS